MWVVMFMAALMFGTVMSIDTGVEDTTEDDADVAADDVDTGVTTDMVDDPETNDETDDEDDTAVAGQVLTYNGDFTLTGTEGNDTLAADPDGDLVDDTNQINLLGGDDFAQISADASTVNGGTGNDTLEDASQNSTLLGGDGNDLISGGGLSNLQGGVGNDTLSLELIDTIDGAGSVSGGDGDDLIQVSTGIGVESTETNSAFVTGGAGVDTFDLELELTDQALVTDGPTSVTTSSNIQLSDFDPDEDILQIEITRPEGAEDRDITETTLTTVEDDDGDYTELTLTFAATETSMEVISTIRIDGADALTLDDIVFVEAEDDEDAA